MRFERRLHREQGGVTGSVVGWTSEAGLTVAQDRCEPRMDCLDRSLHVAVWTQSGIEFRVVVEVPALGHALHDVQAAQDFRLAGHDRLGGRIDLQDALQLADLVLARLVDQRAGGGVGRRDLLDGDEREQRPQQDVGKQGDAAPAECREQQARAQFVAAWLRTVVGGGAAPVRRGRGGGRSGGSVQHRWS